MLFTPVDDQILIERDPAEKLTSGGLHIPERDASRPLRGTVLAVGPGPAPTRADVPRRPCSLSVGEVVLFARYAGHEVQFDGRDCLVLRETEVLGVLTEEE